MIIRDVRTEDCQPGCDKSHDHGLSDVPRIREIVSGQGFSYEEPDWKTISGKVLCDDHGVVRVFELARPTVEMYAGVDATEWATPGMKATGFARLDEVVSLDLKQQGFTDQHCWVPPVCKAFSRRLQKFFGWCNSNGPDGDWAGLTRHI